MIGKISHLKLEKGSIIVIQSDDVSRELIENLRKMLDGLELGFKVPIIAFDEDSEVTLSHRDEVIRQLDSIIDGPKSQ